MGKEETCLCASGDVLLFACSGGSNVGQIANQTGIELAKGAKGRFFCLAGIGAHLDTMLVAAKGRRLVAIDGCPVQCAKKTLEHAGLEVSLPFVVTELGIEKNHDLSIDPADCEAVVRRVEEDLGA